MARRSNFTKICNGRSSACVQRRSQHDEGQEQEQDSLQSEMSALDVLSLCAVGFAKNTNSSPRPTRSSQSMTSPPIIPAAQPLLQISTSFPTPIADGSNSSSALPKATRSRSILETSTTPNSTRRLSPVPISASFARRPRRLSPTIYNDASSTGSSNALSTRTRTPSPSSSPISSASPSPRPKLTIFVDEDATAAPRGIVRVAKRRAAKPQKARSRQRQCSNDVKVSGPIISSNEVDANSSFKEVRTRNVDRDSAHMFQQRLHTAMCMSQKSLKELEDYDKANGNPRSHASTMVKTERSRRQLLEGRILKKWDGSPLISFEVDRDGIVVAKAGTKPRAKPKSRPRPRPKSLTSKKSKRKKRNKKAPTKPKTRAAPGSTPANAFINLNANVITPPAVEPLRSHDPCNEGVSSAEI